jgi:two-component system sensor histidine kinase PilS (NtrC family)
MILPSEENDITLGFSIYPLLDPEGSGFGSIFIFQDLTSIKEMEREIEKNRKLALLGEMSAVLAHEMRSPLASISGSIRLLMESLTVEGSDRRLMEIVLRGKDQLENLARDFLLFARPDNRSRSRVAVGDLIAEVIESVRFSPGWSERVDIISDLCERSEVHGNVTEIRQALLNLVLNAFQAMPDGGRLEIRTRLGVDNHGAEVLEISISDTGCGIEEEQMNRVGEPFYTTKEKGTGLGLAIVNRIAESHGGSFRIESVPNKRTVCTVVLPVGEQAKR